MMKTCVSWVHRIRESFSFRKPDQKGPFARTEDEQDYNRKLSKELILRIWITFIWLRIGSTNRLLWKKQRIIKFDTRNVST
jgi:hypothetical protein